MAKTPWNKGLTTADPRVAIAEAKRRAVRVYESLGGRAAANRRYHARLRERDPLGLIDREKRSRALAKRAGSYVEVVDYRLVIERDGMFCGICRLDVVADDLSFDHIVPLRSCGEHVFSNIRVTHAACNSRKGEAESRAARVAAMRKRGQQPSR